MPQQSSARRLAVALALAVAFALPVAVTAHDPRHAAATPQSAPETAFLAATSVAMAKMMRDMEGKPTGDIDRDFVAMMVPHHQGAIEMAMALLKHTGNAQLQRLAQEIIVTQQQEIAAMHLAIGEPLPPALPAPTAVGGGATEQR